MTGHSTAEAVLHGVLWPDATLEDVAADYDSVTLRIRESTDRVKLLRCEGYIGFSLFGFWDEAIIERAEVATKHPAIERCVNEISRRLGTGWIDSGNTQRNARTWAALIIHLLDGCTLEIVAANFSLE